VRSLAVAVLATLFAGCDGCEKKTEPAPQPNAEPSVPASAPVVLLPIASLPQIPKDGGPPSDPMLGNVGPMPMPPPSITEPLVTANNAFAFDMYKRVAKLPDNVVFSPASISMAFAMTWPGAKGETAAQIKKTMHFGTEPAATAEGWGKTSRALGTRAMKLRIANRLFGEKTYAIEQPFLDMAQSAFGAPLEKVDFKRSHEAVRERINGWVAEQTEKRIKDLLPPRSLTPDARLVLANAVYFLADWSIPFDPIDTKDEPFFASGTKQKNVPTMHRHAHLLAAKADGVTVVELPYARQEAAMLLVLPDRRDGINALDTAISAAKLDAWKKSMTTYAVDLAMPRFEITTPSLSLGEDLKALGMPLAFDAKAADFTGIGKPQGDDGPLFIGAVRHKAFVHVDEKGTEAAAATAGSAVATTSVPKPPPPLKVTVDHPFLFFIVEKDTGLVLFMGRVTDPS
jgi:serpin B